LNGVTVAQTLVVAERRLAALPAELAGSLVLAAADALVSLSLSIGPQELVLLEDGTIRICGGTATDEFSAEQSVRYILEQLLLGASSVTPALLRAARRPSRGNLAELVRELEVALIPTNRGAARRALARLSREVAQALAQSPELQRAADERASFEHARAESASAPVVAPPPVYTEPEEEFEIIELEMSPSLPVVPVAPAAAPPIEHGVPTPPAAANPTVFEIPDLEIPGTNKAEFEALSDWQPVEHTVKLEMPTRPTLAQRVAPTATFHSPMGLAQSAAFQFEYVELSDDDVREATAELPAKAPPKRALPPKPPMRVVQQPLEVAGITGRAQALDEALIDSEAVTAEPFLLVAPSLGQAGLLDEPWGSAPVVARPLTPAVMLQRDVCAPQLHQNEFRDSELAQPVLETIEDESSDLLESEPTTPELNEPCLLDDERTVLEWMAAALGVAPPEVVAAHEAPPARAGSKRCRNALLRSLGWVPRHPTFREGYRELLPEVSEQRSEAAGEGSSR